MASPEFSPASQLPGGSPSCPTCDAVMAGTVQVYDRYYLLKCNCGGIFMWPRKRTRRGPDNS